MREFSGSKEFETLKSTVTDAYAKAFPVEKAGHKLELKSIWVDDADLKTDDFTQQKKVKLAGGTWGAPVYATLVLKDATGKILDEMQKIRLATIPKLTPRSSYIVGGNEYQVANQMIRKPGAYVIRSQRGDTFKGSVFLSGDNTHNLDIQFDPTTNKYTTKMGQANIPLYPLLKSLGVSDQHLAKTWGEEIFNANRTAKDSDYLKIANKLTRQTFDNKQTAMEAIQAYAKNAKVDPEITKLTLGNAYDHLHANMLLDTSNKLLKVYQGKQVADDPENLLFKEIRSVEDMIHDRLTSKKEQDGLKKMLGRQLGKRSTIKQIVDFKKLTAPVESFFIKDNRTSTPEQYNPVHMLSERNKITIHGTGGIQSEHAISDSLREVHPSHLGFIDPVATPECFDDQTEVFTSKGWVLWKDVTTETLFACNINGRIEFNLAEKLYSATYDGVMYGAINRRINYLVTPNHRMWVRPLDSKPGTWRFESAETVNNKPRTFQANHLPYIGTSNMDCFELPHVNGNGSSVHVDNIDIKDWLEFLGWYLSEGCVTYKESTSSYLVRIAQSKEANPDTYEKINALLKRLPWKFCTEAKEQSFAIGVKQLAHYLKTFGFSHEKYIPEYCFHAPLSARRLLLDTLLLGDGRIECNRKNGVYYKQEVFCTSSVRLKNDVVRLCTDLGLTTTVGVYKDKRSEAYYPIYEVRIIKNNISSCKRVNRHLGRSDYYTCTYSGMIYCATVPGGLLLVKRGRSIPIWLGNSEKTGTILHLAAGVVKDGRSIRTQILNIKTGKMEGMLPKEVFYKRVAFPDEYKDGKFKNPKEVRTQYQGKIEVVASNLVDYVLPSSQRLFSYSTNLIPFLKNNQGNRAMMASKHLGQAIPLVEREAPLVQTELHPGMTLHKAIGEEFALRSTEAGVVKAITHDYIQIGDKKIPVYNNFPLNQKTSIHHNAVVKVGDSVKAGQLIADSSYTRNGVLALGKNLNVAYLPYPGETFEDGIVITESAAKKLAAEQIYKSAFELEEGKHELNLRKFISNIPNVFTKDNIKSYDDQGVIKKGTIVKPGQVMIAALRDMRKAPENATLARINKGLRTPFGDASIKYSGEFDGVVTDVVKRGNKTEVYVKSVEPAREADKLSGVHGNKGVISKVIPDNEAPRTKDGKIPDVFLNPHGIIGRINLGQLFESAASKIALKTGKPYIVKNFDDHDTAKHITAEMKAHGLSDTEEMFLPNGKSLGKVNMGNPYILRLAKTGKTGFSARMPGQGYDANLQPTKGGEEGTKQMDLLTIYSMLSHGAKKNLIDAHQKSERNDEYWHALEMGKPLPAPKTTFAYNKFVGLMKGAGINVEKKGTDVTLAPMTDKDVMALSKGKIAEPEFLHAKNLKEIKGGFFDTTVTGGLNGTRYAHLDLPTRMPNPVFESAIKSLTGLKQDQYINIVSGKLHLDTAGKLAAASSKGSVTGGQAISKLLDGVHPDTMIPKLRAQIKAAKDDSAIDGLNRKIRYLTALKDLNLSASDAYTRTVVPVVPPVYRPIQEVQGRGLQVAPVNHLYQNLALLSKAHEFPVMKMLGDVDKADLRSETYKATRALAGLEDVVTRGKDQPIKGFISQITDVTPKKGFFLNKLISKRQDLVGRGVIVNGPDLHVDELGIPEKMAWTIFNPFIVREMIRSGYKPEAARKEVDEKTGVAKKMLQSVMNNRTVMMNRAPSLHKFSIMAFKPKLTDGLAIQVPSLVYKGLNADVDGDAVSIHIPSSEEAVRESLHMMPSRNLFKPGTGELMLMPSQEAAIGLYFMSQTKEGRESVNKILPPQYHIGGMLNAKDAKALYEKIAKEQPTKFADIVSSMKKLGDNHAYEMGFTASIKDVVVDHKVRDAVFKKADEIVAKIRTQTKPGDDRDNKIAEVYTVAAKEAYQKGAKLQLAADGSSFHHMVASGSRGKDSQLQQMVSAPGIVMDSKDRPVPVPIKKSYAEGISTSDYFVSSYGVRKGITDRSLQTSKPGALNKDIMASTADNVITAQDCGTHKGIDVSISSRDCLERLLSSDQHGHRRNTPVTSALVSELTKKGVKTLKVRSPLSCIASKGTCASCFGHDEFGKLPELGDNIGIKMGQTMSEPMTQLIMRCTQSTVVFKIGDTVYNRSMEDIFHIVPAEVVLVDGRETKHLENCHIWDVNGWVSAEFIQRHKPDVDMHMLKTNTGDAVLVQADHPIYTYKLPVCVCGNKANTIRFQNKGYSAIECTVCKRVFVNSKSEMRSTEAIKSVAAVEEKEDSLWITKRLPDLVVQPPKYDPYIVGFYLAEGCVRRGDKGAHENSPVAVLFSQHNDAYKDHLEKRFITCGLKHTKKPLEIAIYDTTVARDFASLCPGLAHEKRLNADVAFLPKAYLADVLAGIIDGDGTIVDKKGNERKAVRIYSSSFILIQQVATAAYQLGIVYNICKATKSRPGDTSSKRHKAQPYHIDFRMDHGTAYLLRASHKVANTVFGGETIYSSPVVQGPSAVDKNHVIDCEYESYTYDVKTTSASFIAGFIRNHNTFHSGGVAGSGPQASGFQRISQILNMPKYIAGEAALAKQDGKITKIEKTTAGGHNIFVGKESHVVRPGVSPTAKVGDSVKKGDAITNGVIKPQNLLALKGMRPAQDYVVNELQKTFQEQGIPIHRKVFETVVRSVANNTRVVEAPKHGEWLPGDIIPFTAAEHYNESRKVKLAAADAVGYHLRAPIGKLPQNHEVRDADVPYLKEMGYNEVEVLRDPVRHSPLLKGIAQLPMLKKDWMAQFGYRYIEKGLTEGAAQNWKSSVEGLHPIPAFAYGANFGKKKEHY